MSAGDVWRWTDERGVQRLVETDELRTALSTAVLPASTLVWREGMKEWVAASSVPELASAAFAAVSAVARGPNAPKPGRAALDSDGFDARGTLKEKERTSTLIGLSTTNGAANATNATVPRVPVTAPSPATGGSPKASSPITRIPPFGGPGRDGAGPVPVIPAAPAIPSPKPAPQRRITTQDVDNLWATTTRSDEDETMPRRALPSELAAAAAATAEAAALRKAIGARKPAPRSDAPAPVVASPNGASAKTTSSRPPPPPPALPRAIPAMASVPAPPGVPSVRLKPPSAPEKPAQPTLPRRPIATLNGVAPSPAAPDAPSPAPKAPPLPPSNAPRSMPPAKPPSKTARGEHTATASLPGLPPTLPRPPKPIKTLQSARDAVQSYPGLAEAIAEADDPSDTAVTGLKTSPFDPSDLDAISFDEDDAGPALAGIPVLAVVAPEPAPAPAETTLALPTSSLPRASGAETTAPLPLSALPALEAEQQGELPSFRLTGELEAVAVPAPTTPAIEPAQPTRGPVATGVADRAADTARRPQADVRNGAPDTAPRISRISHPDASQTSSPLGSHGLRAAIAPDSAVPAISRHDPSAPSMSRFVANADDAGLRPPPRLAEQVAVPLSSLVGAGGVLIGMVVAAFFVGRASLAATSGRLKARPALGAIPALARAALPPPPKPCWMAKQPAMWAPSASRTVPFDAVATTGGTLAVGYARDAHDAVGIEVDLATGEVKPRLDDTAKEDIERVVPTPAVEFKVARAGAGPLHSPIDVPSAPPFAIGVAEGAVALASPPDAAPAPLWPLPGDEGIGAASVRPIGNRGFALVFRRGAGIWGGFLGADRKPLGELVNLVGSGGAVGKPAVAWNGREVAVIFGDRPDAEGHYEIRVSHGPPGALPPATTVLPLPRGGPGGDAFAPDIAGLPDGRWLLMWTEGASGARAVRAQTLAPDFSALGDPIALSPPAGNFGQGVIGVAGGHAATIFLSKGASSYELWGAVLSCSG